MKVKVTQSCPTLFDPMDYIVHEILQARITGVGGLSLLQGIFPTQGLNLGLLLCRQILLPAEPQGKPKNIGVGSLSLLQQIFPTQEFNWGLLHYREILYQLRLPGSSVRKESACSAGDLGLIPGLVRFPGEGNGYSLQHSCLEKPRDRGAWWATVHGVTKSWT